MALKTTAKKSGDFYRIDGEKVYVSGAGACDIYLTFCRSESGDILAILIPKDTEGLEFSDFKSKVSK